MNSRGADEPSEVVTAATGVAAKRAAEAGFCFFGPGFGATATTFFFAT
jgi:hypothetical protein